MKSYLCASLNFEETWVKGNILSGNNVNGLGKITDTMPDTEMLPEVDTGRTWLLASANIEQIGEEGGKLVRAWRLSGFRGWDTDVYNVDGP